MAEIEHKGVIRAISGNEISVEIVVSSACEKCHLKGACQSPSEKEDRLVSVIEKEAKNYKIGEEVTLFFSERSGIFTVFMSYIMPLIICVLTLYFTLNSGVNEPISALLSLASIIVYFIILYIFRHAIQSKIKIKIKK